MTTRNRRTWWKSLENIPRKEHVFWLGRNILAGFELFRAEPWCRACKAKGLLSLATIRDHITPLAEGGPDVTSNTQPLCQACSDAKTRQESKRGRSIG
jgi:5-methylcytosine-specific restriction protein A